jgi:glutamate dehydrogenase
MDTTLATRIGITRAMYTALNIIDVAETNNFNLEHSAKVYFAIGEKFNILWFRDYIANDTRASYWDSLARLTLRDELDLLQKDLTTLIVKFSQAKLSADATIETWMDNHKSIINRWHEILGRVHASSNIDYVMFFIALRELSDLLKKTLIDS